MPRAVSVLGVGAAGAAILGVSGCAPNLTIKDVNDNSQPLLNATQAPPVVKQVMQTRVSNGETAGDFINDFAKSEGLSVYYDAQAFGDTTVVEFVFHDYNNTLGGAPMAALVFGVRNGKVLPGDQPSAELLRGDAPGAYTDLMAAVSKTADMERIYDAPFYSPRTTVSGFTGDGAGSELGALGADHVQASDQCGCGQ